jgi:hypothetical protein
MISSFLVRGVEQRPPRMWVFSLGWYDCISSCLWCPEVVIPACWGMSLLGGGLFDFPFHSRGVVQRPTRYEFLGGDLFDFSYSGLWGCTTACLDMGFLGVT